MANIFLSNETFNASNSNSNFYGTAGTEKVVIKANTTNQMISADIEEVYFEKALSSYTFEQSGTTIKVYEDSVLVSSINVNADYSKKLAFLGTDLIDVTFEGTGLFIGDFEVPAEASGVTEGSLEKPTTTISNIEFKYDTGYDSTDLITSNWNTDIVAKLSAPLTTGEKVYGSIDNGIYWQDITSMIVDDIVINWRYGPSLLYGENTIKFKVVSDSGIDGDIASANYIVDSTTPEILDLSLNGNDLIISTDEEVTVTLTNISDSSEITTSEFSTSSVLSIDSSVSKTYIMKIEDKARNDYENYGLDTYVYTGSVIGDIINTEWMFSFYGKYIIPGEGQDKILSSNTYFTDIDLEETTQVEDNVYIKDNSSNYSSQTIKAFATGTDKLNLGFDISAGNTTFTSSTVDLSSSVTFTTGVQEITGVDEKDNMTEFITLKYAMSDGTVNFASAGDTAILSLVTTTNNTYLYKVTDTNNDGFVNNDEVTLITKLEDTNLDTGDIVIDTVAPDAAATPITYSNTNIAGGGTFTLHFSEALSSLGSVTISDAASGSSTNAYLGSSRGTLSSDGLSVDFTIADGRFEAGDIITLMGATDLIGNTADIEFTLA